MMGCPMYKYHTKIVMFLYFKEKSSVVNPCYCHQQTGLVLLGQWLFTVTKHSGVEKGIEGVNSLLPKASRGT